MIWIGTIVVFSPFQETESKNELKSQLREMEKQFHDKQNRHVPVHVNILMALWSSGAVSVCHSLLGAIVHNFGSFMQHNIVFITFTQSFYTL